MPELGRTPGEVKGYPLQYSCLDNSMDRGAWRATVHGVTKSWHDWATFIVKRQQNITHDSELISCAIMDMVEITSKILMRSGFNSWVRKIPWSRKWQPTPVFLPGKFHGQRRLADYSAWDPKESKMTEQLSTYAQYYQSSQAVVGIEWINPSKSSSIMPNIVDIYHLLHSFTKSLLSNVWVPGIKYALGLQR